MIKLGPWRVSQPQLTRIATYASVSVASFLILLKFMGWWFTGSVSILASLLDSALDVVASLMILLAVRFAQIPADAEHRFGHGKAEPLAALAQSVFIIGSAFYLLIYAIERLINPQPIEQITLGIIIMVISIFLTFLLVMFQRYVVRQTQSTAIKSDALHYITDLAANSLVIIGLLLAAFYFGWIDAVLGLFIALFIGWSALKLARDSANQLLDIELPDEMRQTIAKIIMNQRGVEGFNDLRTYRSGPNVFIQFDLELDDRMPLVKAHHIAEMVTEKIQEVYPQADVIVHQEPVSLRTDPQHHQWGRD
ncbi:cation diffusion facilitator family transporter [Thiomicrospira cyclica]|uniref:Cation-efflux pump FieF n=1 Tax=Thiomicrospira cyclica (strain DSM 14477 / JCM 11371 / ALM1) TaxID=717773 RepID=F6D930_THICA|nr:cation diffusion facilitator family transporter [Thiomicrospira cyclica]AEG30861.1 cation diffusion facilitator family transporter [Thiomicrospira cyclica ALM1]